MTNQQAEYASSHGRQDERPCEAADRVDVLVELRAAERQVAFYSVYYKAEINGFVVSRDTFPADDGTEVEVLRIEGENEFSVQIEFKHTLVIVHSDMMCEVHHGNLVQLKRL